MPHSLAHPRLALLAAGMAALVGASPLARAQETFTPAFGGTGADRRRASMKAS